MIESNDLRIGNKVWNRNSFEMFVVGIFEKEILLNFEGNEGDVFEESVNDVKPIPLTEEWLFAFGFEMKNKRYYHKSCMHFEFKKNPVSGYYMSIGKFSMIAFCAYVHQLQNLIHSLTGQELQLTDK